MAHYAYLDQNGFVIRVIIGKNENEIIDWEKEYNAKRTSYNTRGGIHYDPETGLPSEDQSKAFRYNYAGIGYFFDENFGPDGAFIPPKELYPKSWILNKNTALWQPPIPMPDDGNLWGWDETIQSWIIVEIPPQPSKN